MPLIQEIPAIKEIRVPYRDIVSLELQGTIVGFILNSVLYLNPTFDPESTSKSYQIFIYHKIMPLIQKEIPTIEEIKVPYRDVVALELQGTVLDHYRNSDSDFNPTSDPELAAKALPDLHLP